MAIKIFADGADKASILELNKNPLVQGFTTNPSLLRKAGVTDYKTFALDILSEIKDKPISFEVIANEFFEVWNQAMEITSWGNNVYVKIPIVDITGYSNYALIDKLTNYDIKINVTAITTYEQVIRIISALNPRIPAYISIFAGRIADTGINPSDLIKDVLLLVRNTLIEVIWASPREVYNIYQADEIGCDIITCTPELISKYEKLKGKDLTEYSRETVKMFYSDALKSGLKL